MTAVVIDGKAIAEDSNLRVKAEADKFKVLIGRPPSLVMLMVGSDSGSKRYVNSKKKLANFLGIDASILEFSEDVSEQDVIAQIKSLNKDPEVDAILVQLPLPSQLNTEKVLSKISPKKDVDGLHPELIGKLVLEHDAFFQMPCTPFGILRLILEARSKTAGNMELDGLNAVVVGRSNLVGKPTAILLQRENATVTQCHSKTRNLAIFTKEADILVSATGVPSLIKGDMIKPGAIVIDVGINYVEEGRIVGDCDFESCKSVAGAITPVPGGVGPMTMAMLMKNVLLCANNNKEK